MPGMTNPYGAARVQVLVSLGVGLLGLILRCYPYYQPVTQYEATTIFRGADSYFHMRRAEWISENYPTVPYQDPFLYYPDEGPVSLPGGYDLLLGSILKATRLAGLTMPASERIVSFINPLLSFFVIVAVFRLAHALFGSLAATIASELMALSPPHIAYSQYGNVDHHTTISLFTALIAFSWVLSLRRESPRYYVWLSGGLLGLAHFSHPGFSAASAVLVATFAFLIAVDRILNESLDAQFYEKYNDLFLASLCATFLFSLTTPQGRAFDVDFAMLSFFHVLILLIGYTLSQSLCFLRFGHRSLLHAVVLVAAIVLLALFALRGDFLGALLQGIGFTAGRMWFLGIAAETKSPFAYGYFLVLQWYTPFILMLPFYLAILLGTAIREIENRHLIPLLVYAPTVISMGLFQVVFAPNAALFVSVFSGGLLASCTGRLETFFSKLRRLHPSATRPLALLFLLTAALYPPIHSYYNDLRRDRGTMSYQQDADMLARRLRQISPSTGGYFSQSVRPEYSVFANRDLGHLLVYRARRPVVVNPLGFPYSFIEHNRDFARFQLSTDPRAAESILRSYRSRYVIIDPLTLEEVKYYSELIEKPWNHLFEEKAGTTELKSEYFKILNTRLYMFDGSSVSVDNQALRGITHLRLLYESPSTRSLSDRHFPRYKLYEVVKGALLLGRAEPGTIAKCSLRMTTNTGRSFEYSNFSVADRNGDWGLAFPYPTDTRSQTGVQSAGKALLEVGTAKYWLEIEEQNVLRGTRIRVEL